MNRTSTPRTIQQTTPSRSGTAPTSTVRRTAAVGHTAPNAAVRSGSSTVQRTTTDNDDDSTTSSECSSSSKSSKQSTRNTVHHGPLARQRAARRALAPVSRQQQQHQQQRQQRPRRSTDHRAADIVRCHQWLSALNRTLQRDSQLQEPTNTINSITNVSQAIGVQQEEQQESGTASSAIPIAQQQQHDTRTDEITDETLVQPRNVGHVQLQQQQQQLQQQQQQLLQLQQQSGTVHKPCKPLRPLYGPFLRFHNVDLTNALWEGSILVVVHKSMQPPVAKWVSDVHPFDINICSMIVLDNNCADTGYTFVRYDIQVPLPVTDVVEQQRANISSDGSSKSAAPFDNYSKFISGPIPTRTIGDLQVFYWLENAEVSASKMQSRSNLEPGDVYDKTMFDLPAATQQHDQDTNLCKVFSFIIPAMDKPWHWSFYSCNGFGTSERAPERDYDGGRPLWRDVLSTHETRPLHLIFGCGDQIYQDDLFHHCETIKAWLSNPSSFEREEAPFTEEMRLEVRRYFMIHYLAHFTQPVLADIFTSIPHLMVVDDHDIYDGFGSYPKGLQDCPVFVGLGLVAREFYLLFQQHTNIERAHKFDGLFGGAGGFNFVKNLGPYTAIVGSDGRFERSLNQISDKRSWQMIEQRLYELPTSCQHVILATGVPMTFPVLGLAEYLMQIVAKINRSKLVRRIFRKSTVYKLLGLNFGLPSNLDDLIDHLNAPCHIEERNMILNIFTKFSAERHCRSTFISGDVHCAGVGKFKMRNHKVSFFMKLIESNLPLRPAIPDARDPNAVFCVISSAITNQPPPSMVLRMFQMEAHKRRIRGQHRPGYKMIETMLDVFDNDVEGNILRGRRRRILGRRNWCEVDEVINDNMYLVIPQDKLVKAGLLKRHNMHELIKLADGDRPTLPECFLPTNGKPSDPAHHDITSGNRSYFGQSMPQSVNNSNDQDTNVVLPRVAPKKVRLVGQPLALHRRKDSSPSFLSWGLHRVSSTHLSASGDILQSSTAQLGQTTSANDNNAVTLQNTSLNSSPASSIVMKPASPTAASAPQSPPHSRRGTNVAGKGFRDINDTNDMTSRSNPLLGDVRTGTRRNSPPEDTFAETSNPTGSGVTSNRNNNTTTNATSSNHVNNTNINTEKHKRSPNLRWPHRAQRLQHPIPLDDIIKFYGSESLGRTSEQSLDGPTRTYGVTEEGLAAMSANMQREALYERLEKELFECPMLVSVFRLHVEKPRVSQRKRESMQALTSSLSESMSSQTEAITRTQRSGQLSKRSNGILRENQDRTELSASYYNNNGMITPAVSSEQIEMLDRSSSANGAIASGLRTEANERQQYVENQVSNSGNYDPIMDDVDLDGRRDGGIAIYSIPIPRLY